MSLAIVVLIVTLLPRMPVYRLRTGVEILSTQVARDLNLGRDFDHNIPVAAV